MELLETTAISHEIERIINESIDYVIIVSPYLKINNRLKPKLANCFSRNQKNLIIYRENELSVEDKKWLDSCTNVTLISVKNLHAKCYLSENSALIASMNLYDYSQINNHEIGVKITIDQNEKEMNELLEIISLIIRTDHPSFDFSGYSAIKREYTMGSLYKEITAKYEFPQKHKGSDSTYEFMCQIAIKYHKFDEEDFKLDKSAIKRITLLDPKVYGMLRREIIKVGQSKI